jgi:hypothetical protein
MKKAIVHIVIFLAFFIMNSCNMNWKWIYTDWNQKTRVKKGQFFVIYDDFYHRYCLMKLIKVKKRRIDVIEIPIIEKKVNPDFFTKHNNDSLVQIKNAWMPVGNIGSIYYWKHCNPILIDYNTNYKIGVIKDSLVIPKKKWKPDCSPDTTLNQP